MLILAAMLGSTPYHTIIIGTFYSAYFYSQIHVMLLFLYLYHTTSKNMNILWFYIYFNSHLMQNIYCCLYFAEIDKNEVYLFCEDKLFYFFNLDRH